MNLPIVSAIPCLKDNYAWLFADGEKRTAAVIDPGEVEPVVKLLEESGLSLSQILLTHHHHDHIGGVAGLQARFPEVVIIGPLAERERLPVLDRSVVDGDIISGGSWNLHVMETPGHTAGHVSYYSPEGWIFCGDVLFSLGCGRCFECPPATLWQSIEKILQLPHSTWICCGHEYTLANGRFALHVDPENPLLRVRLEEARQSSQTVPVLLEHEIQTNPFMRIGTLAGRRALGFREEVDAAQAFSVLRLTKDNF